MLACLVQAVALDTRLGWQLPKLSSSRRWSHRRAVQLARNPHYEEQRDDHHGSPIQEDKCLMDVPCTHHLSVWAKYRTWYWGKTEM